MLAIELKKKHQISKKKKQIHPNSKQKLEMILRLKSRLVEKDIPILKYF